MKSLKKLRTKCNGLFVSLNSKKGNRSSQESLEENGMIRVEIEFNAHCNKCVDEVRECCESMPGVSEVDIDVDVNGTRAKATVIGVFQSEKLVHRIWKKCGKKAEIVLQGKIGGESGGVSEQEEEKED